MSDIVERRMDAYYYSFTPTGVAAADKLLGAVACAGKAFHHTEDWCDEARPYDDHVGSAPVDWIQNAAREAADLITALRDENEKLTKRVEWFTHAIHTCHDECDRPLCKTTRERDALRAELERKDAALRTVGEGDVPRPIGTYYREDKTPSKNDQCIHGLWMYEECGQCIEAFCRAALSPAQKEGEA